MTTTHQRTKGRTPGASVPGAAFSRRRLFLRALCALLVFFITPGAWTQYPFPPPPPLSQPGALTGPTLGASLRNAAASTQIQAETTRKVAADWSRRAGWPNYRAENFQKNSSRMGLA